jgi:DNA-binding PadR family transcriptional regulator
LALLKEKPMHGYELIQEITARSEGLWKPSPGSVYPTLQLLADADLVTVTDDGGKRLYTLTDAAQEEAATAAETPPWLEFTEQLDGGDHDLGHAGRQLLGAVQQIAMTGSAEQKQRAAAALNAARKNIYAILGEE